VPFRSESFPTWSLCSTRNVLGQLDSAAAGSEVTRIAIAVASNATATIAARRVSIAMAGIPAA
jgi:hypothetical protein